MTQILLRHHLIQKLNYLLEKTKTRYVIVHQLINNFEITQIICNSRFFRIYVNVIQNTWWVVFVMKTMNSLKHKTLVMPYCNMSLMVICCWDFLIAYKNVINCSIVSYWYDMQVLLQKPLITICFCLCKSNKWKFRCDSWGINFSS